jgi:Rab proteins geranylgeranyltransferase component A
MTSASLGLEDIVYDAIIVGTGLPESILSAALSLSGASVLHVDSNAYYGLHHASLRLQDIDSLVLASGLSSHARDAAGIIENGAAAISLSGTALTAFGKNVTVLPIALSTREDQVFPFGCRMSTDNGPGLSKCRGGRITLDLVPRTVLAAGTLVDLLIQTGVGHYLSFRPLDATYLFLPSTVPNGRRVLQKVPASRSDVFQSTCLTNVEKRVLMRFLKAQATRGINSEETAAPVVDDLRSDPPAAQPGPILFEDLLRNSKLTGILRQFVFHCIAFTEDVSPTPVGGVSAADGCDSVRTYLKSLLRYQTPTPFLYPNYGTGEMCEAFCRLSAVHGGVFVLRKEVRGVVVLPVVNAVSSIGDENISAVKTVYGVMTSDGDCLRARYIFVSSTLRRRYLPTQVRKIWRCTCVLENSAFASDTPRTLSVFPKGSCGNVTATVRVLQLNSSVEMCPEGMYILYAETVGGDGAELDLACAVGTLVTFSKEDEERFEKSLLLCRTNSARQAPTSTAISLERPQVLWSIWFSRPEVESTETFESLSPSSGLSYVRDVGVAVDCTNAVKEAERCFRLVQGTGAFFPPPATSDETKVASVE